MLLKEIITQYRAANGLSQRAFAAKCNVTNGYISMLENGKNPTTGKPVVPSLTKLSNIAEGMGITLHQLLQSVDDMEIDISNNEPNEYRTHDLSPAALRIAAIYDATTDPGRELLDSVATFVKENL